MGHVYGISRDHSMRTWNHREYNSQLSINKFFDDSYELTTLLAIVVVAEYALVHIIFRL